MLAVGHPLLDQEEHEAGRHEGHGEDHADGHKHVHSTVVTAGSRKKHMHSEFAAAAAAFNADGSDAGGGNSGNCMKNYIADGQMCGDTGCPFSGVTSYGRVWKEGAGKQDAECEINPRSQRLLAEGRTMTALNASHLSML